MTNIDDVLAVQQHRSIVGLNHDDTRIAITKSDVVLTVNGDASPIVHDDVKDREGFGVVKRA